MKLKESFFIFAHESETKRRLGQMYSGARLALALFP